MIAIQFEYRGKKLFETCDNAEKEFVHFCWENSEPGVESRSLLKAFIIYFPSYSFL